VPALRPAPPRLIHEGSATRFESRVALGSEDDEDEPEVSSRQYSWFETTSGLPDDSRESDERAGYRHLVDLRSRIKIAKAGCFAHARLDRDPPGTPRPDGPILCAIRNH
jgi:hypothetical protein